MKEKKTHETTTKKKGFRREKVTNKSIDQEISKF